MDKDNAQFTKDRESKVSDLDYSEEYWRSLVEKKEIEIQALKNEKKQLTLDLEDYIHIAAHELKSPTANLKLISYLIDKSNNPEEILGYVENIKSTIKRLDVTINSVVEGFEAHYSIIDDVQPVLFDEVFQLTKSKLKGIDGAEKSQIEADFQLCPQITYIRKYIQTIIQNLLENAIKFQSPERDSKIVLSTKKEDDFIVFQIIDNGIGINLTNNGIANLFKPFTKFSKKKEGVGIGLHITKTLVEKNGGKITIESNLNEGTTFKVYLKEYDDKKVMFGELTEVSK